MTGTQTKSISALLQKVIDESDGDKIEVREVIDTLGARGFGPLLLFPAVITLLPTGALPLVQAICGFLIICLSLQIALGRKNPWLPERLKDAGLSREKFETAFEKKKKLIGKIDGLLAKRLKSLTRETNQRVTGAVISLLALGMIVIGFIPFAPDLFVLPILFFALGYMTQDGLFVLLGYAGVGLVLVLAPWLIGQMA